MKKTSKKQPVLAKDSVRRLKWGKDYEIIMITPREAQRNPWNPNRMDLETFEKEKLSITNNGFIDPIKVRELEDGSLEIVDGEHRWRAAQELGLKEIPAINLGPISDEQAKKLTIIANELRGAPEPVLLSALLKDLNKSITVDQLSLELPMSQAEIESMVRAAETFDWASISDGIDKATQNSATGQLHRSEPETTNPNTRVIRVGNLKGEVPDWIADAFYREYERSAAAVGSKTPEVVFKDLLERLQVTAEAADEKAAQVPKPTGPKKRLKRKDQEKAA